ncbi:MAG: 4-hydroxy-tetrahydrodipicolinate reductase [Pelagibacteraceae bacterium]|nr:4-hydroxy-tetrahydrodipicolinate reductase [Pelagibacteraceae bacterium]|tara:strand:+ start:4255 stop:5037 length:783 start_codon:yes stop_codon:yes gene_type:complete
MSKIKIAIAGVLGRMGNNLVLSAQSNEFVEIVGVFDKSPISPEQLSSLNLNSEIATTSDASFDLADIVIDFTSPSSLFMFTESAVAHKAGLVVGTTGLEEKHFQLLKQTSTATKVFYAPNMSLGVNSFLQIARGAAGKLKDFDIEIIESHHKHKVDAPSGTAIKLGEEIADEIGRSSKDFVFDRQQQVKKRKKTDIGFSSIRGGNISGEHRIIFHGENEDIEITHRALNRRIFSDGAINAAVWLNSQNNGYFIYKDLLKS